ncbi:MAG: hypothetical protein OEY56_11220 [Cyclobacteriaceae bacterium]|nr:hypothetical protein [Cyclobacteriaceae bacterium]
MIKYLALFFLLITTSNPAEIARVNRLKKEAERAFMEKDFETAIRNYRYLSDSLAIDEDPLNLNLAHAYFQSGDTTNARSYYATAATSDQAGLKSIAYQQLGVIAKNGNNLKESLQFLKASIKADPTNQAARYDYELVKKLLKEQEQNQGQDKDKVEPSEYAKNLKMKSDELRYQGKFNEALSILQEGLKRDKTIEAYNEYMGRLAKVIGE